MFKNVTAIFKGVSSIPRHTYSQVRWYLIRLYTWPIETAQRRRRRQMMQDYIRRLQDMRIGERSQDPRESEV